MNKQLELRRLRAALALLGGSIAVLSAGATQVHGATPSFLCGTSIGILIGVSVLVLMRLVKVNSQQQKRCAVRVESRRSPR